MASIGAISDGLSTIVQPAAMAGATLQAIWFCGQFHGVMKPQTPIGFLADQVLAATLFELEFAEMFGGLHQVAEARSARAACASHERRAHLLGHGRRRPCRRGVSNRRR